VLRTGRATSIDGTGIAFSEWGNLRGPPVVLIHGWIFSRVAFDRQQHGELAERCRVIAYDLRGHGESGKPDDAAAYSNGNVWAADLDSVLQTVAVERPVLAGWSLGGRVAAHYVFARGRERVAGLNLVSSRILQDPNVSVNGSTSVGAEITSDSSAEVLPITARFVRDCTNQTLTAQEQQSFLEVAMSVPPVARRGASAWHVEYGHFFDELNLPVLVTHGGSDSMTLPVAAETIARRLRGKLSIYPGCGHMPFREAPDRFNHELAQFAEQAS
jgi:non-heme chloroperoxidase